MNSYVERPIPIIDLFAGPGGLGEGFSSVINENNQRHFKIALSIEKDDFAHQTLLLRSFLRQFPYKKLPPEYYQFVRGEIEINALYKTFPLEAGHAKKEAWRFELGKPETHHIIDKRIKEALKENKDFVLIGGPPCQAYSVVGRSRRQEIDLNKNDIRVFLYREYYRILAVHRPPVFIMENVKGLLSSKVDNQGVFKQVIEDLQDPIKAYKKLQGQERIYKSNIHYNIYSLVKKPAQFESSNNQPVFLPKDFVIKAEDYGIPQTRHRVILLGIRSDIDIETEILKPSGKYVPVENVLDGLPRVRSGLSKKDDESKGWTNILKAIKETRLKDEIEQNVWERMLQVVENLEIPPDNRGRFFVSAQTKINYHPDWFLDENIGGFINHETRSHIKADLYRYLFVSCFAEIKGRSPKLSDFPFSLLPKHGNITKGIDENKFGDRFRTQLYGHPSKTVTSHISKDGHYYIHPDPNQCRSLTVREAARIQTFPDNYFFCGPRTEQFHQVGNAVPPLLAYQIANIVSTILL